MKNRSLEQRRAANALARIRHLENGSEKFRGRYRAYVDRMAPSIVMNGLGQALATELAAAGEKATDDAKAHQELYNSIQEWLCDSTEGVYRGEKDLLEAITRESEERYLIAQAEALAWLEWHKKFCRAFFPKSEEA